MKRALHISLASLAWVAIACSSCSDELTQIVVVVDSDLAAGELDSIDIVVEGPTASNTSVAPLEGPDAIALPLTMGLVPKGDALGPVTITAIGKLMGAEVLRRSVTTRFAAGRSVVLLLGLLARCRGTLGAADCDPREVSPDALPPWDGAVPRLEQDGNEVVDIVAGGHHACAVLADGHAWCWGARWSGQVGDGTISETPTPSATAVLAIEDVARIALGTDHSCAIRSSGTLACWGGNQAGQLGVGTMTASDTPLPVTGLTNVTDVIAGERFTCATGSDGVQCWGDGALGQLGDGTTGSRAMPGAAVALADPAVQIAAGRAHACARSGAGAVVCWGANNAGQIGDGAAAPGPDRPSPVAVSGLDPAEQLAAGGDTTCARLGSGSISCWGGGADGEIGNGEYTASVSRPVPVLLLDPAVDITLGSSFACARTATPRGTQCWGDDTRGQLGDGSPTMGRAVPADVPALAEAVDIGAGAYGACALLGGGSVVCWGENLEGQTGTGAVGEPLPEPAVVQGLPN